MLFHKEFFGLHQTQGLMIMERLDFLGSIVGGTKEVLHANAKNLLFVPDDPGDSQSGCRNLTGATFYECH
jgi:hypothetical protein